MTKKIWTTLLLILIIAVCSVPASAVELIDEDVILWLEANHEVIFPVRVMESEYHFSEDPLYYTPRGHTASDTSIKDGETVINIYGEQDMLNSYLARNVIHTGSLQNFYLAVDVSASDIYPADKAACAVSYTDRLQTGIGSESNMAIYLGDHYRIEKNTDTTSQMIDLDGIDTGNRIDQTTHVEMIRIFGYSFFFVDGTFLGQAMDGFTDPLLPAFNATLFPGGESASCRFDNLEIRKMTTGNPIGKTDEQVRIEAEQAYNDAQLAAQTRGEERYEAVRRDKEEQQLIAAKKGESGE